VPYPDALAMGSWDARPMTVNYTRHSQLAHIRVGDCMHHGIFACGHDASARDVAALMAKHHVHAVAVTNDESDRPVGIISALDIVAAAASGEELTADRIAGTEFVSVSANQSVQRAAQLMTEHGVSHLIVLEAASGLPIGILSTFDIGSLYAG
jgi:CBS domain-containing protein